MEDQQPKRKAVLVIIFFLLLVFLPVTVALIREMQARKAEVKQAQPPAVEANK